ncbi:hypothetical protein PLEOSDRAFT_1073975 [Pleurotus ostreatus PC15]|uniref:CxC2-like cysteine cluster KDZ transposase-associated domain-containing protein n=1 Tax=Pleurotus ostreatus (strain PC15) TaxID=1137138 RepID=A0A067P0M4_PLEO1|nr:hypothetical protein PLEOSDRAFT_1073975 [Pleurotus ostreatus PC15]
MAITQFPPRSHSQLEEYLTLRSIALDELIRLEGLGDHVGDTTCVNCAETEGLFRCMCCQSNGLSCTGCTLAQHGLLPLHRIERWNGKLFEHTTLKDLGLRVQLGHGGNPCRNVQIGSVMTVFDTSGIHTVHVDYCLCKNVARRWQLLRNRWFPASFDRPRTVFTFAFLDQFHELNLQGKITLYDYYLATSHLTDNMELRKQTPRRPEFHRTMRMWRQLQMLKRAGRAHDPSGIQATRQGQLAIECPACPHPDRNLPLDWESATRDAWLYTLFLAIDANFKLKSKSRGLEDVELDPGWSYFVNDARYKAHLLKHSDQPEINTCRNEHDAILRATTRHTPGYDVSGVALVICARHAFVRGNGAGDLEKGERYCSIDYIVLSALLAFQLRLLVLSYDIACQWSKNLIKRSAEYPAEMQPDTSQTSIKCVVPRWHIEGHDQFCQTRFSFNYTPGVGKTCGEDIESTWSVSNQMTASIREMAPSARREALNDHWSGWNFRKLVKLRSSLLQRLKDACTNSIRQTDIFAQFNTTFRPAVVARWGKMVEDWERDKRGKCPYKETPSALTIHDVQLELAKEEMEASKSGRTSIHRTSASKFLLHGLNLEEKQRALARDCLSQEKMSPKELAEIEQRRNTLLHDIMTWRAIQLAYMPCVATLLASPDSLANADNTSHTSAEQLPLFLPSGIPSEALSTVQVHANNEIRYRLAQAEDGLAGIRRQRRVLHSVYQFKKLNVSGTGNKPNTRIRSVFDKVNKKIAGLAQRYRAACAALLILDPQGTWVGRLRELADGDIRGPGREGSDPRNSYFEPSWIWLVAPAPNTDVDETQEPAFDETMRIEWAKTKARADRWVEELQLVQEEMRRSLQFLAWKADWWCEQATRRGNIPPAVSSGLSAYALKQASFLRALLQDSVDIWLPALSARGLTPSWTTKYSANSGSRSSSEEDGGTSDSEALRDDGDDGYVDYDSD